MSLEFQQSNSKENTMSLEFQQSNFADNSNQVTNTFLPLIPGTQFTFEGVADRGDSLLNHEVIFTVTDLVRTIDGVNTVVLWDRDINNGVLQEAEIAFLLRTKKETSGIWANIRRNMRMEIS